MSTPTSAIKGRILIRSASSWLPTFISMHNGMNMNMHAAMRVAVIVLVFLVPMVVAAAVMAVVALAVVAGGGKFSLSSMRCSS